LKDVQAPKNSEVNLTLIITADPIPDITWIQNGKEFEPNEFRVWTNSVKELEHNLKEVTYNLKFPKGKDS
jgi:hypothetical protein